MTENELYHFGVKGMKWGVRRNRSNLGGNGSFRTRRLQRAVNANNRDVKSLKSAGYNKEAAAVKAVGDKNRAKLAKSQARDAARNTPEAQARREKIKKAAIIGTAVVGTTLAAYGAYKASKYLKEKAGKLSYESGKKYAYEHFFSKMKDSTVSYDWRDRKNYNALYQAGKQTLQNTDKRTKRVSGSTIEAIKYLRHPESYLVDGELLKLY